MSLIVTVYTNEGIVMASDSRTSYNRFATATSPVSHYGLHFTESTYKTFLCGDKIGISTCGDASVNDKPIAGYVESFINNIYKSDFSVEQTGKELMEYFYSINPSLKTIFHISGYKNENNADKPIVLRAVVSQKNCVPIDTSSSGAMWDGEQETMFRLIKSVVIPTEQIYSQEKIVLQTDMELSDVIIVEKNKSISFDHSDIAWNLMTLQDAVDFAVYAIKTTIDTMRFQLKIKSVGGPIDVLIIKPDGAKFLQRKELAVR